MKNNKYSSFSSFFLGTILFIGCKKSNESSSELSVKMTDAPFDAQEVNIDIKEVRVNFAKDTSAWITLNTNARIYNLLTLQNNRDTAIATGSVSTGTVKVLRLILGAANSIKSKIKHNLYCLNFNAISFNYISPHLCFIYFKLYSFTVTNISR